MLPKNRVTIADVAEYAQISTMTVSRVVNNRGQVSEKMRLRVQQAMHELGYKPNRIARSLASNQTFKIGVIVPNMSSAFFAAILESIEHVLWMHDYYMVLSNSGQSDRREQDILDVFEQDRVDGVLIFGSHLNCDQLTTLLRNQRAAVIFNGEVDPKVAGQIVFDEKAAIQMAIQHLMDGKRTHIGYVGVDKRTYSMRARRRSFEEIIAQLGGKVEGWIIDTHQDNLEAVVYNHLTQFPQTDGILCFNDEIAADILLLLGGMGKSVPQDVAVIGYDDIRLARWVTPQLTTMRLTKSISELGELAAKMLLERIEGKVDEQPVFLNHELIIRESTP